MLIDVYGRRVEANGVHVAVVIAASCAYLHFHGEGELTFCIVFRLFVIQSEYCSNTTAPHPFTLFVTGLTRSARCS